MPAIRIAQSNQGRLPGPSVKAMAPRRIGGLTGGIVHFHGATVSQDGMPCLAVSGLRTGYRRVGLISLPDRSGR
jgi:hypothetical protein